MRSLPPSYWLSLCLGLCAALAARTGLGLDHGAALLLGAAAGGAGGFLTELTRGLYDAR